MARTLRDCWRLFGTGTPTEILAGDISGHRSQKKARNARHHTERKIRTESERAVLGVEPQFKQPVQFAHQIPRKESREDFRIFFES